MTEATERDRYFIEELPATMQRTREAARSADLTGRTAYCGAILDDASSGHKPEPSSRELAFFEFCGEGSEWATLLCADCGFHECVHHETNRATGRPGDTSHPFKPRGDRGFDSYYCGHGGWD